MYRSLQLLVLPLLVLLPLGSYAQQAEIGVARQYVEQNAREFAAPPGAAGEARITAAYHSRGTGLTHVYLRQTIDGVDVRGGDITVSVRRDGTVLHAAGSFFNEVDHLRGSTAAFGPQDAALATAQFLGFQPSAPFHVQEQARGADQMTVLSDGGVAAEPVEARLLFEPTEDGLRLAWDVTFHEPEDPHVWSVRVDAGTGEILARNDYVVHDHWGEAGAAVDFARAGTASGTQAPEAGWHAPATLAPSRDMNPQERGGRAVPTYRVFAYPLESPNHGGRTLVTDPSDPDASPFGWHDTDGTPVPNFTTTRGNNVFAYVDANNSNQPNGTDAVPDGGEDFVFDFPVDFTQHPQHYRLAAVTNLFYWNNLIHDVLHHYGFDEPAGNFQQYNYTGQGIGNDAVRAEAQDGGGMNNANFFTPVDGQAPRMQMYLWNTHGSPPIDGDFDNGVIAHEYAHGWSIRLTGGPGNVSCLQNQEQMGEGWSDYLGLILTMRFMDYPGQVRGIGTFVLNQPVDGPGIRPAPYSTSLSVNNYTYGNIGSLSVPHGVGFVWATMLWEMTWNLIDVHGFSTSILNGNAGNNIALRLVSEAMKLQPCSPGFVDGRDAILAADQALYDGANAPYIWKAFAKRGLGYSASQGSSSSTSDGTEAFDLPPGMARELTLTAEPELFNAAEIVSYAIEFINGTALEPVSGVSVSAQVPEGLVFAHGSASEGGTYDAESRTVTFAVGDVDTGESATRTFKALANLEGGSSLLFEDDMEEGTDAWETGHGTGTVTWFQQENAGADGGTAWYARNMPNPSDQYLFLEDAVVPTDGTSLTFRHRYDTELRWDGGVVEISVDDGPWQDLGALMTSNGYNETIRPSATSNPLAGREAFTGNSNGYRTTVVDLSSYVGQSVRIRFRMGTDSIVGYPTYDGWYVDHVLILDEVSVTASVCGESVEAGLGCAELKTLVLDGLEGAPVLAHDFEEQSFGLEPDITQEVTLSISNLGDRDLTAVAGVVGLEGIASVTGGLLTVAPDGEQEITLTITTADVEFGTHEGELSLVTNDPDSPVTTVPVWVHISGVGSDPEAGSMPDGFLLEAVHPNPFTHSANLSLRVGEAQDVTIDLYDVMGRQVLRLHDGRLAPDAEHRFMVDGGGLASGVYIVSIRGEHFSATRRITRLR